MPRGGAASTIPEMFSDIRGMRHLEDDNSEDESDSGFTGKDSIVSFVPDFIVQMMSNGLSVHAEQSHGLW
jgi:hypothetical protein